MPQTRFTWKINNFDMCPQPQGQAIESPCFSIDAERTTKFSLLLYPRGYDSETTGENCISLFLKRHFDDGEDKIELCVHIRLLDASNILRNDKEVFRDFCKGELHGHRNFIERKDLIGGQRLAYFSENVLTVYCVVCDKGDKEDETRMYKHEDYTDLSSNLDQLLESGNHSDIVIRANGKEFKAHTIILENRCPGLMSKLVKLENSNTYSIPLLEDIDFQSILKFIYTGSYDDSTKFEKIICASSLSDLKLSLFPSPCVSFFTTEINVFNVVRPWYINTIDSLECRQSCYLFSNELPKWSWMKISLVKVENETGFEYWLKFKRISDDGSTLFLQCELHDHTDKHKIVLKHTKCLFIKESEWTTPIKLPEIRAILMLSVRVSACFLDSSQSECQKKSENKYLHQYQGFSVDFDGYKGTFQRHLHNLHRNMKNADVTLRVGSQEIPAHKAILSCRSDVFSKMFEHDTKENQTGIVDIDDVEDSTMSSLVMYMYCGDIEADLCVSSAIKLYTAADKYQVLLLKDKCRRYLKDKITTETINDILPLASIQQDETLKESCYTFVTSNSDEILKDGKCLDALKNRLDLYPDILDILLQRISQLGKNSSSGVFGGNVSPGFSFGAMNQEVSYSAGFRNRR